MMKAVDDSTSAILDVIEKQGLLDNTVVVLTSDHGYFYGEHCLGPERRLAYEETIRIPLLVRYPSRFRPGSSPAQMVSSVDVGATALTLAGVPLPKPCHGRPLWTKPHRDAVLVEYNSDPAIPRTRNLGYYAVRTDRWKYIRYRELTGADELYDLRNDPFELNNAIGDRAAPLSKLQARLSTLLNETGASVT